MDKRAAIVAGGGMHHHPSGLVDDNQDLIFVEDVEGDGFGGEGEGFGGGNRDGEAIAHIEGRFFIQTGLVVAGYMALLDQFLEARSRQIRNLIRQPPIQAGCGLVNREAQRGRE